MKIKLHNKYEIIVGDKSYTAYNTITKIIFDAINNFKQYGAYLAVGCGTEELGYNTPELSSHLFNYPLTVEEIQCDPSKGPMYVKRTLNLTGPDYFNITEFGLTDLDGTYFNVPVYSHVYIRGEDGSILPIYKSSEVSLFVRVTTYLEVDDQTKTVLTAGDNMLVKAILGELDHKPQISVVRGYNNTPNGTFVHRNKPRNSKKIDVYNNRISPENGTEQIEYSFDARTGETAEIVLLFDDEPVARLNTLGNGSQIAISLTDITSQDNYTLDIGENIINISEVVSTDGTVVSDYKVRNYAKDFTDFIADPFEANFTSQCPRWVSSDGDKLAFVADGTVYIYLNKNYALYKINNNISSSNLQKIIMFQNYIFVIYNSSPHFTVYVVDDTLTANQITTNMATYENLETSYDWQDVQIIPTQDSEFMMGIILGAIARRPVVVKAVIENQTFTITQATYGASGYIVNSFALYKNNFCNSMIGFVTNNHNNVQNNYRIEQWYADFTSEVTNEIPAFYLCNGTVVLEGKSRAVIAKMNKSPYIWMYYYPQVYRYSISLIDGVQNWISTNLMYIIQKYENTEIPYKIYSLNDYNNPQEFINGFPSEIDLSTVTDFEFLNDTLLIFTTDTTYALNLKVNQTVLENLPQAGATYNVSATQEQLMGKSKTEGVMGSFTVVFNL